RLRQGDGHLRPDFRRAQQRGLPVQPDPADPCHPSRRRLDAGKARRPAQRRVRTVIHAARPLRRGVFLGPDLMAMNYDKMLALKIRDAEQTYTEKDTILYALGVGMGQDPTD